jgi:hypothetical protein
VIERTPELKLGRVKYPVASYSVGCIMQGLFFEVKGCGESYEAAFKQAESRK